MRATCSEYETINSGTGIFFRAKYEMELSISSLRIPGLVEVAFRYRIVLYVACLVFIVFNRRTVKLKDLVSAYRYDVSASLKFILYAIACAVAVVAALVAARFMPVSEHVR